MVTCKCDMLAFVLACRNVRCWKFVRGRSVLNTLPGYPWPSFRLQLLMNGRAWAWAFPSPRMPQTITSWMPWLSNQSIISLNSFPSLHKIIFKLAFEDLWWRFQLNARISNKPVGTLYVCQWSLPSCHCSLLASVFLLHGCKRCQKDGQGTVWGCCFLNWFSKLQVSHQREKVFIRLLNSSACHQCHPLPIQSLVSAFAYPQ